MSWVVLNLSNDSSMFNHKVTLILKDCHVATLFLQAVEGAGSKQKDYKSGLFAGTIKECFHNPLVRSRYKYEILGTNVRFSCCVAIKMMVKE